jgi:predicted metal-dependent hydrolase
MSSNPRQVTLDNEPIEYHVTRSEDATEPRIDVGIHDITVVLPVDAEIDPERLLVENGHWVLTRKQKYDSYREQMPERVFEPGETFPYLGDEHELHIEPRQKSVVTDGNIRLRQSAVDQSSVERALRNFYRREARDHLSDRLNHFATEMGIAYDGLEIRNQRTRWGSCSTNGTISLNWRLIMAPTEIVDYVVVHELAHLREPNHTEAFWQLVNEYDSEYSEHAAWLEENSARLIFSDEDL